MKKRVIYHKLLSAVHKVNYIQHNITKSNKILPVILNEVNDWHSKHTSECWLQGAENAIYSVLIQREY